MHLPRPLPHPTIVKKKTNHFKRHQSDEYQYVKDATHAVVCTPADSALLAGAGRTLPPSPAIPTQAPGPKEGGARLLRG